MSLDREALRELQESMERLGQPFPDTLVVRAKTGPKEPAHERIVREVQETREARRDRDRCLNNLYGPAVKKSDFLKTTAIPTGPGPKPVLPFERVDLRRVTNAIQPALDNSMHHSVFEDIDLNYYGRDLVYRGIF